MPLRKNSVIRAILTATLMSTAHNLHAQSPATTPPASTETPEQHDARMAWWRAAKFGMFIHWGVYSVPAGYYHGKPVGGIGEWIMHNAKIPMAEYQQFAKSFDPVKFDADAWVAMAKAAGVKYIVITAKHHEGFAMFPTKASTWNIMDRTKFGRDPLKELAAACRKQGIRLGFYYSQAQDWNNGGSEAGGPWDPAQKHDMDDYINKISVPQVRELLTNYGPDVPAVVWWDTAINMNPERAGKLNAVVHELRPDLITNNRLGGGYRGDTDTPEQFIPARGYPGGRDWESCMTMNDTWGFKRDDKNFKSSDTLLRNLIDITSKGGNYLLNVGPDSLGQIPQPEQDRLLAVGKWLATNGEAIYGTTASPFARLPWGRATKKVTASGATVYLEVFDWPKDGKLVVPGLASQPQSVTLLAAGQTLTTTSSNQDLIISVPPAAPDPVATVIKLEINGPLQVEDKSPAPAADGTLTLNANVADVNIGNGYGKHAVVVTEKGHATVTNWVDDRTTVSWICKLDKPGAYAVEADFDAAAPAKAMVKIDGKDAGSVQFTPGSTQIGTINAPKAGELEIKIAPQKPWKPVDLRSLTVKPAA